MVSTIRHYAKRACMVSTLQPNCCNAASVGEAAYTVAMVAELDAWCGACTSMPAATAAMSLLSTPPLPTCGASRGERASSVSG
jgi:hypothetical protein